LKQVVIFFAFEKDQHLKALDLLQAFEESADCSMLSWLCDDADFLADIGAGRIFSREGPKRFLQEGTKVAKFHFDHSETLKTNLFCKHFDGKMSNFLTPLPTRMLAHIFFQARSIRKSDEV